MVEGLECIINWDNKVSSGETDRYSLRIRTGCSILLSNRITVLKLREPVDGVAVQQQIFKILNRISREHPASKQAAGDPEIRYYGIPRAVGTFTFAVVWGIVLNGSRKGKLLQGEYRFVILCAEQLDDCLKRVFKA